MTTAVADDFVDAKGWGKVSWLLLALARLGLTLAIGVVFLVALATIDLRYDADAAAPPGEAAHYQALLAGSPDSATFLAAAAEAKSQADALQVLNTQLQQQQARLDQASLDLRQRAQRAGCSPAPSIDEAERCTSTDPALQSELTHYKETYLAELEKFQTNQADVQKRTFDYEVASRQPGAALAPVLAPLAERDALVQMAPWSKPIIDLFFTLPIMMSGILMAFLAGLLGSAALLFIMMTFPNYLPLTFGGGSDFFLRMFTGGVVAILVQLVLLTGTTVPGLESVQGAINALSLSVPGKQALAAVGAGFFSEQIAKTAKGYVDGAFHGGRTPNGVAELPLAQPPVEGGAMGPGAAAGQV
ncbi:MAG TPA: hypothetical protein VG943_03760 [Caulobacterales bacterium]|nr:hypothetical protein [Caulobacterales bacterium]